MGQKVRELIIVGKKDNSIRMSIRFPEEKYKDPADLEAVMSAYIFEDDDVDLHYDDLPLPTGEKREHPKDGKVPKRFKKWGTILKGCDLHGKQFKVEE